MHLQTTADLILQFGSHIRP